MRRLVVESWVGGHKVYGLNGDITSGSDASKVASDLARYRTDSKFWVCDVTSTVTATSGSPVVTVVVEPDDTVTP